jgi:hypothetical protein
MINPTLPSPSVLSSSPSSSSLTATTTTTTAVSSLKENTLLGILGTTFLSVLGLTLPFITMQLRSPLPYMGTPVRKIDKALQFILVRYSQKQQQQQQKAMSQATTNTLSTSSILSFTDDSSSSNNTPLIIPPPRYVDLGSGDGSCVLHAAKLGYIATGIELNTTLFLLSVLRQQYHQFVHYFFTYPTITTNNNNNMITPTLFPQQRAKFIYGNMFTTHSIQIHQAIQNANVIMIFGIPSLMKSIASLINTHCNNMGGCCYIMSYRFKLPLLVSSSSSQATSSSISLTSTASVTGGIPINANNSNDMTKKEEDDSTTTTITSKDDENENMIVADKVDCRRMNGGSNICSNSSNSGVVDAILIYDDEEMRIYEVQKKLSVNKK